jgi:hypothetical protein
MARQLLAGERLVLASHNAGKLTEIADLLRPYRLEVVSAASLGLPEPEETADDFVGNARIKALAAATATGLPALVSARRPDDRVSGRRAVAAARSSRTIRQALALRHPMPRYRAALEGGGVVARAVAPVVRDRGAPLVDRGFDARRPADIDTSVRGDEHRRRPVSHAGVVERRFDGQAVGAVDTKGRVGDRLDRAAVVPEDMARMVRVLFADEARRPPSGVTGFDSVLSPIFPGRKPGF